MLDDLKSFFATSSVAEVGVGVTIGAAFAGVVGAAGDTVQSLLQGDLDYAGLAKSLVVLLSVLVLSVFGVVKPLARLKEKLGRVQAAKVADAVQQARSGDVRGAVGAAREAGLPLPGGTGQAAAGLQGAGVQGADVQGAGDPVAAAGATGAAAGGPDGQPLHTTTEPSDGAGADASPGEGIDALAGERADASLREGIDAPAGVAVDPQEVADGPRAPGTATDEQASAVDGRRPVADPDLLGGTSAPGAGSTRLDPLTAPLAALGAGAAGAAGSAGAAATTSGTATAPVLPTAGAVAPAGSPTQASPTQASVAQATVSGAGASGVAVRALPSSTAETKPCPFCAFDIPAVATRCGWCTSDLGDLERADVDALPA